MQNDGTKRDLENIRTLADLESYTHSERIKSPDELERSGRLTIINTGCKKLQEGPPADVAYLITLDMQRAARELAERYPDAYGWLPDWKPRVAVKGGGS